MIKKIFNRGKSPLLQLIFCLALVMSAAKVYAQEDAMENLTPSAPPELPAMDFSPEYNQFKIEGMFTYMEVDMTDDTYLSFYIPGILLTMTNSLNERIGYSYSFGAVYEYFEDNDGDIFTGIDGYSYFFPISFSLAYRIYGDSQSSNAMLFSGINISYMNIEMDGGDGLFGSYDLDYSMSGYTYGLIAGMKVKLMLAEYFSLVPFGAVQYSASSLSYSSTTTIYNYPDPDTEITDSGSVDADAVTSLILGFDIEIGGFSIGTMLDAFNSNDATKYSVNLSYTFKM